MQLEESPCPLGCDVNDEFLLSGRDMLHKSPGEFNIVRCRSCDLIRTNPRPIPTSMVSFYPDDYGPYKEVKVNEADKVGTLKKTLRPLIRSIFNTRANAIPVTSPGKILEVGCASGHYLHVMDEMGWTVEGIEFSKKAAARARGLGLNIHTSTIEESPVSIGTFDLLVGWMVLEHLHQPVVGLTKLFDMAKPDAWLVLSVPNMDVLGFRLLKSNWYDLHLPNHLYHFSPYTLTKVLERSGWSVEKVIHQRTLNNLLISLSYFFKGKNWIRTANWLHHFTTRDGIWFYLLFPIAWILSIFGETGRMTVWARKCND